jgi:hypothetical protein
MQDVGCKEFIDIGTWEVLRERLEADMSQVINGQSK